MKGSNVFVDSNILVYSYSKSDAIKQEKAISVMHSNTCHISTQVISEFCNVLTKKMQVKPLKVKGITKNFELYFNIFTINKRTTEIALDIMNKYKYSYYDSLILASALESDCSIVYSEDMQHEQVIEKSLKIVNPFLSDKGIKDE